MLNSYVSSIMSAVPFLEAVINELYSICAEEPFGAPIKIGKESIQKLSAFWQVEKFQSSARTLEKYQVALQLMNKPLLDIGSNLYQDANLVIQLRNLLVHYKPELQEIAVGKGIKLNPDKIASKYRGKFPENPFAARYAVISRSGGPHEAAYPFFPEKCLGAGCANWAYLLMLNLSNQFFASLGITWSYQLLIDNGHIGFK